MARAHMLIRKIRNRFGRVGVQDRVGELGVRGQGGQFEGGAEDQPEEVEVGELMGLLAGARQLGEQDVLAHEEQHQERQRDLHVARDPCALDGGRCAVLRSDGRPSPLCFHVPMFAKL